MVFNESDVCDLVMQGRNVASLKHLVVDNSVNIEEMTRYVDRPESLLTWRYSSNLDMMIPEFHLSQQSHWHMPAEYQTLDIAEYILSLCENDAELQRCGAELLLYQERNLFDLLRYLKYLVDVMTQNRVIWGVGRGSSVASFILYKMGVHRVNSLYYNLDISEFLR